MPSASSAMPPPCGVERVQDTVCAVSERSASCRSRRRATELLGRFGGGCGRSRLERRQRLPRRSAAGRASNTARLGGHRRRRGDARLRAHRPGGRLCTRIHRMPVCRDGAELLRGVRIGQVRIETVRSRRWRYRGRRSPAWCSGLPPPDAVQPVDCSSGGVPCLVPLSVVSGWRSAARAPAQAGGRTVVPLRDDVLNAPST